MNTNIVCYTKSLVIFKFFLLLILIITPAVLFAQDISIWDFRIPETKYQRLTGSLSGGWNKTNNDSYSLQNQTSNSGNNSNYGLWLGYNFANYNENNSLEIAAQMMGRSNHQSSEASESYGTSNSQWSHSQTSYQFDIVPNIRYSNYLIPDTWFWFAEGSGGYSFNQNRDNSKTTYSDGSSAGDSLYSKNNSWNASVGGGIGYGKLRDGSSVFSVLRILDKLAEDSVLVRPLTKDEVLQIVDIFVKQVEYVYTQDRYVKFFMKDIYGQLQRMGVLKENATTAYSVLRTVEVLSERIEPRLFGWRARIGVQRRYAEAFNASDYYIYSSSHFWNFHDYVSLDLDYGYPLSLNLQVNSSFSMKIPRFDYQRKIDYRYEIAGMYQVGERIDATVSGSVSRTSSYYSIDYSIDENDFFRTMEYNIGISFRFFIENNVNFYVNGGYSERHSTMFPFHGYSESKSPTIRFGVDYRFL